MAARLRRRSTRSRLTGSCIVGFDFEPMLSRPFQALTGQGGPEVTKWGCLRRRDRGVGMTIRSRPSV